MPRKELSAEERRLADAAAEKTFILYEGRQTPHRSCGIALAETFGVPWRPYQSLRRGGVTGAGECGAIKAGELILGEFFGAPEPTGAVTPVLREALTEYQRRVKERISKGASPDYTCNNLTAQHGEFTGAARMSFCTRLAAEAARTAAEVILEFGGVFTVTPIAAEKQDGQS